jgi:hypothetical protein
MSNVIDFTGYRYAKKARTQDSHTYDALMYALGKEAQKQLERENSEREAQRRLEKDTSTLYWVSVSTRLPEPGSRRWFAVILEHVGCQRSISGSQFVNGGWAHIRDAFVQVTHWAELPEELP